MRKFFVSFSVLAFLALSLPVFAGGLPKTAKMPDGSEIAIPDPLSKPWPLIEKCQITLTEDKESWRTFCGEEVLPENSIVLLRYTKYDDRDRTFANSSGGTNFYFEIYYAPESTEPVMVHWVERKSWFVALVKEDGMAIANTKYPSGLKFLLDENNIVVGFHCFIVGEDGKIIAERRFLLKK